MKRSPAAPFQTVVLPQWSVYLRPGALLRKVTDPRVRDDEVQGEKMREGVRARQKRRWPGVSPQRCASTASEPLLQCLDGGSCERMLEHWQLLLPLWMI